MLTETMLLLTWGRNKRLATKRAKKLARRVKKMSNGWILRTKVEMGELLDKKIALEYLKKTKERKMQALREIVEYGSKMLQISEYLPEYLVRMDWLDERFSSPACLLYAEIPRHYIISSRLRPRRIYGQWKHYAITTRKMLKQVLLNPWAPNYMFEASMTYWEV